MTQIFGYITRVLFIVNSSLVTIGFPDALYEAIICYLVLLLRLFCFVYCVCFSIGLGYSVKVSQLVKVV